MSWELLTAASTAVLGWLGMMEKRISTLKQEFNEKIEAVKELHTVQQKNLDEKMEAVEKKLDFIIEQMLRNRKD